MNPKIKNRITLVLRLVAAVILLQTLFFKFTGAEESKFIFRSIGAEPWGRWFSGISELIASLLLLIPATQVLGAVMGLGIMLGALATHAFVLGIVVQNDGGLLFGLACTVTLFCSLILILRRDEVSLWIHKGREAISSVKASR